MRKALIAAASLLVVPACSGGGDGGGGGTGGNVATTVVVTPGTVNLNAIGASIVVHASVRNQSGGVISGASVAWSSSSAAATVTGLGGDSATVTAAANGSASITAQSGAAQGSAAVTVAQTATTLQKTGGDAQTGAAGAALATQLRVKVLDRLGNAVAGATVSFAVTQGGGSVSPPSAVSAADGTAATTWTLGTNAAATQEATAGVTGTSATAVFNATSTAAAPASIVVLSGNNATAGTGSSVNPPPSVKVTDAFGNPVVGATVTFTVTGGGGSVTGGTQTTDANGVATVGSWTLGSNAGANTLSVAVTGSALAALTFNATAVTSVPGAVLPNSGTNQAAMASSQVPEKPSVQVHDPSNNPIAGLTVTFTVLSGGGSVTGATTVTDASGVATVGSWTLGGVAGPNTLRATVSAPGLTNNPVTFTAAGCEGGGGSGYAITLCFTTPMTASQRAVFESAAARWQGIITNDIPNLVADIPGASCGATSPSLTGFNIDDLLIFAGVEDIDGPGAILGSAGFCYRRGGAGGLPVIGLMRFDAADVANLETNGLLQPVFMHEMGHVLGIGSLWSSFGLLQNPSSSGSTLDTYFSGPNAIAGFDAIGGTTYTGGQKVPVENTGGQGTWNSHWRETVLKNELMTGYINNGSNPLSQLTVRSLQDLGYIVNVAAADPLFLTLTLRGDKSGTGTASVRLVNDVYTGPAWTLGPRGRRTLIRR
jgi:hypothetical protein